MLKFIKWVAIGTVATVAGGYFVFGSHIMSYLGTAANSIRDGISGQIPIDFELKRAENLIREIDPQLHSARRDVAEAQVELADLEKTVERLERQVQQDERKLKTVSTALADGGEVDFRLATYERTRVEINLSRTFDNYKNNLALLDGKRALIERQAKAVAAAQSHLDAVRAEKARLEDMVAALKTQKKQLDTLAANSKTIELDDTALGRARDVLENVKRRLDVAQKMLEDDIFFAGGTEQGSDQDIALEIQRYFAEQDGSGAGASVALEPIIVEVR